MLLFFCKLHIKVFFLLFYVFSVKKKLEMLKKNQQKSKAGKNVKKKHGKNIAWKQL